MLRSKSPDLVLQEIWDTCAFAIRSLMTQAADHVGRDPDRLSFTAALRIVRQSVAQQGAFSLTTRGPPTGTGRHSYVDSSTASSPHDGGLRAIVIKRKMPKWHVKRAHHAHWPQPRDPQTSQSATLTERYCD